MVDINTATGMTSQNVMAGVQTGAVWTTILLVGLGLIGLWLYVRYIKSFNHMVWVKRPLPNGGFEFDVGYKGRFVFKKSKDNDSKKIVFQIFQARKKKLSYNQESDAYEYRIPCMIKGRRVYLVIMEPDSEGFLHPVKLDDKSDHTLEAILKQADLASYEATLKEIADKYDNPDFMAKYGLLIYIILILVVAALYWWGSRNYAKAMDTVAQAISANTQATIEIQKLTTSIINGTIKNTAPPVILS